MTIHRKNNKKSYQKSSKNGPIKDQLEILTKNVKPIQKLKNNM